AEFFAHLNCCRIHLRASAAGMNGHHGNAQLSGFQRSLSDGVWNVVKFQIEKYFATSFDDLAYDCRARRHVKLAANLEHSRQVVEILHEAKRILPGTDVESDRDLFFHCFMWPTRSRVELRPLFFRNFSRPLSTLSGALGS